MDFVSHRYLLVPQAVSPHQYYATAHVIHSSSTNFPFEVILVIGMMFTSFFLLGWYLIVVKFCCLNRHHVDHRLIFSLSRHIEDPLTASEPRGLEEATIRLISVIQYNSEEVDTDSGERSFSECSVCLSEFQQNEKLRIIPNCSHIFHIDCIDVWLQSNACCPLCRRIVSLKSHVHVDQVNLLTPRPSRQGQSQNMENLIGGADEGFVVIDLDGDNDRNQNLQGGRQEELPTGPIITVSSQSKLMEQNKEKKLQKKTSLGDEYIGIREPKMKCSQFKP